MRNFILIFGTVVSAGFFIACGNEDKSGGINLDSLPPELKTIHQKYFSDNKNPEFYSEKSIYFFKNGEYDSAYACMNKAIYFSGQKPKYYLSLADLYLAANETKKSKQILQQCVKSDSTNVEALMKLGELFFLV